MTWDGAVPPPQRRLGARDWLRILRRGLPFAATILVGLLVLLALRLIERPVFGARRPLTPWITQGVCQTAFFWMGLARVTRGRAAVGPGVTVANHASWLDIFALNAGQRVVFVSKSEVASWPGVGWLAQATGTVFIRRAAREADSHRRLLQTRLGEGHRLAFFPEGTSTDGQRVLSFKPTLFAALFTAEPADTADLEVQPVTVRYCAPPGAVPTLYGWWGETIFGHHLLSVLAAPRQGRVEVTYHAPLRVSGFGDRKALARTAEAAVRAGLAAPDLG